MKVAPVTWRRRARGVKRSHAFVGPDPLCRLVPGSDFEESELSEHGHPIGEVCAVCELAVARRARAIAAWSGATGEVP